MIRPYFSIAHPTARPDKWKATRDLWLGKTGFRFTEGSHAGELCVYDACFDCGEGEIPGDVEYVACFDFGRHTVSAEEAAPARRVYNTGKHCSVDATNMAVACTTGQVIVVVSDDFEPCENWCEELRKIPELWQDRETVLKVSTGGTADARGLLTLQILNRKRYERFGYLFHPAYVSMYSDDEFSEQAFRDGVVVDATHLLFPHRHWSHGEAEMDDVYRRQNLAGRYRFGEALLKWRKERGFPNADLPPAFWAARAQIE